MFTGLIEAVGEVLTFEQVPGGARLVLATALGAEFRVGESVAVNGVCLTVVDHNDHAAAFDLGPGDRAGDGAGHAGAGRGGEPRARGARRRATRRALRARSRRRHRHGRRRAARSRLHLGDGRATRWSWRRCFVLKGSVAVDGISLTVARLTDDQFDVQIVPHTETHTTMRHWRPGTIVNLECDVIGKYVARATVAGLDAAAGATAMKKPARSPRRRARRPTGCTWRPDGARRRRLRRSTTAIAAIRDGKMVVVVDDEDRENEGDLTIAAERVTPGRHQLHGHARPRPGVSGADAGAARRSSRFRWRCPVNSSLRETAMCVSIDARGKTSTGISAADRAATMLTAIAPETQPAGSAAARPRVSAAGARRAACSCGRATPRRPWIWRAWPGSIRPA